MVGKKQAKGFCPLAEGVRRGFPIKTGRIVDAACPPSWKTRYRAGRMTGNSPSGSWCYIVTGWLKRVSVVESQGMNWGRGSFGEPEGVIGLGSAEASFGAARKTRSSGPCLMVASKEGRLEEVQVRLPGRGNGWGGFGVVMGPERTGMPL
jgi:hypothetical protein